MIIFQLTILHNNVEVSVFYYSNVVLTTDTYLISPFFFPKRTLLTGGKCITAFHEMAKSTWLHCISQRSLDLSSVFFGQNFGNW